jgi:hypothetical protein
MLARAAADGSLKKQKKANARKGGGRRKLEETEESQNPQGWRRTEVTESRRIPKFARTAEDGSFGEQKDSKVRKDGGRRKFRRAEGVETLRSGDG